MEMILPDTSVWIDFIKGKSQASPLKDLLNREKILFHEWVFAELVLGNLGPREKEIKLYFSFLPLLDECSAHEVLDFVEHESLSSKGLSFVDVQLLYGAVKNDCFLWTFDKALRAAAGRYHKAYLP